MKTKFLFPFVAVSLFACKKESVDISLLYPRGEIENHCDINFSWDTDIPGPYRLSVSKYKYHEYRIIDVKVNSNQYLSSRCFAPGEKYYWYVLTGEKFGRGTFTAKGIQQQFEGEYFASVYEYDWAIDYGILSDTTYRDTVTIKRVYGSILVSGAGHASDGSDEYYFQFSSFSAADSVYAYISFSGMRPSFMDINVISDSIFISHRFGGIGWGTVQQVRIKM